MKIFEILLVSIDFGTSFLIFSLASRGSAPEPPTSPYLESFLNFSLNFWENFDNIFKNSENFLKIFKIYKFFIDFLNIFWKFSSLKKREIFYFSNEQSSLPKRDHCSRDPPPKRKILYKLLFSIMDFCRVLWDTIDISRNLDMGCMYFTIPDRLFL